MAGISLSGLASGLDTTTVVSQLMAIERQASTRLQLRQSAIQGREAGLKDVQSRLTALKTAATAIKQPTLYAYNQDIKTADSSKVGITRTGSIAAGTYDVAVESKSVTEQWEYSFTRRNNAGTITLAQSGKPDVTVNLAANATLDQAVAAINAKTDAYATAANVNGKLVLTSKTSGTAGGFTVTSRHSDIFGSAILTGGAERAGADARFTVNGTAHTSPTDSSTTAIPGLTLDLKAVTTSAVTLTIGEEKQDTTKIKDAFKAFVDAYNAVVTTVQSKVTEKRVNNATTSFDAAKGQLFGDRGLVAIVSALRSEISEVVAGNPAAMDQLSEIGISVPKSTGGTSSSDARLGKLVWDEAKFTEALTNDPAAVQRLAGGVSGVDGFAQEITKVLDRHIDTWTDSGVSYKGSLVTRLEGTAKETDRIKDQMERLDLRLEAKGKRLTAQFAAMEKALSLAQTQQSWLSGQLAGLTGSSS